MADQTTLVKAVIAVLHDGAKGFPDLGEHLKDTQAKYFFLSEATTRGEYARELEAALASVSSEEVGDVGGTTVGAIHRTWGDLKAKLGGGDHTLLETAEQGEDAAKKAYKEALEGSEVSDPRLRQLLTTQQTHIIASHDKVKAMRDTITA